MADLFDTNGNAVPWNFFKTKHSIPETKYFNWMRLIDAIPNNWKNTIKMDLGRSRQFCIFKPHFISNARILPLDRLSSKEVYNIQLSKIVETPTSQNHIQKLLNVQTLPWKNIYTLARSISIDSYSRVFQYKCLNSILYLNLALFKMGLCDSPLCSYCHNDNETIPHLFYFCDSAMTLWTDIRNFFSQKISLPLLTLQSAVVGFLDDNNNNDNIFINNILLMYKITLYRNRDKGSVTLTNVIKNLRTREKIERNIAGANNNKLQYHDKKWRILYDIFDTVGKFFLLIVV